MFCPNFFQSVLIAKQALTTCGEAYKLYALRIIKEKFLRDAAERYPKAEKYLTLWRATVRAAHWQNMADLRNSYRSADMVQVKSEKPVVVFDACGNTYRLIAAIHFNSQVIYTLRFLTHSEYSKDKWKDEL